VRQLRRDEVRGGEIRGGLILIDLYFSMGRDVQEEDAMADSAGGYRLVTRSDFDGLVCAVLLTELELIEEIKFVHPKDMQDGLISITDKDITTNLPYVEGAHLVFDHHYSEAIRVGQRENHLIDAAAKSAARVVYQYYGGAERFPDISEEMMQAVDKADAADFTIDEVLHPSRWILLNFIMDARTGLGRFKNFRISNYQLMMDLIDYIREYEIDEILALSDVAERVSLYFEHEAMFKKQLRACARIETNVLTIDLRDEDVVYAGNRFIKYALFPQTNISVQIIWGFKKQNTVFTVGKSIFNRTSKVNVGKVMLIYKGGGHEGAGTCQVPNEEAEVLLEELIERLKD
jgi:nanoRNase/pAp phosphatase (c-di-AMP/oligoRNAs hydrolase)